LVARSTGGHRLFAAVITRAVLDFHSTARCDAQARRSARLFLFSDNPNVTRLREYLQFLVADPDAFIRRLRRGLLDGSIRPTKVAVPD
jgi:hypothetical protein